VTASIRTKSVYEPPSSDDGRRVLTTQYWARGVPRAAVDEYVRILGPSRELLHAFKRGEISWSQYKDRYLAEMEGEDARREIKRLADVAKSGTITLMCVCKDEDVCHRTLLRDLIQVQGMAT
jgi:uncharacterized protein YeaO (DUF488 family)